MIRVKAHGILSIASFALLTAGGPSLSVEHQHEQGSSHGSGADTREVVHFPEPVRVHTLANMRDHLLALQQIQQALGSGAFDQAADIAEQRLGMTSLRTHGAHEIAPFMPEKMQQIGTEMHHAASRFALAARDASATGEIQPALTALAGVMAQCVACHAAYRVR